MKVVCCNKAMLHRISPCNIEFLEIHVVSQDINGKERESIDCNFSIGRCKVSTFQNFEVIRRLLIRACEKAELVDVNFSCLMINSYGGCTFELFRAIDEVYLTGHS